MNVDLVHTLNPPRMPAEFVRTGAADILAAFGVGLLIAAALVFVLAPLFRRRPARRRAADALGELRALPASERLVAGARLLAERGVALPDRYRDALYLGTPYDPADLERLVAEAWGGGRNG